MCSALALLFCATSTVMSLQCLHPLVTEKCIPDEEEAWVDQKADVHHLSEHAQNGIAVVELQIEQLGIWEEEMD